MDRPGPFAVEHEVFLLFEVTSHVFRRRHVHLCVVEVFGGKVVGISSATDITLPPGEPDGHVRRGQTVVGCRRVSFAKACFTNGPPPRQLAEARFRSSRRGRPALSPRPAQRGRSDADQRFASVPSAGRGISGVWMSSHRLASRRPLPRLRPRPLPEGEVTCVNSLQTRNLKAGRPPGGSVKCSAPRLPTHLLTQRSSRLQDTIDNASRRYSSCLQQRHPWAAHEPQYQIRRSGDC